MQNPSAGIAADWQVAEINAALKEADAGDFATLPEARRVIRRLKHRAGEMRS